MVKVEETSAKGSIDQQIGINISTCIDIVSGVSCLQHSSRICSYHKYTSWCD